MLSFRLVISHIIMKKKKKRKRKTILGCKHRLGASPLPLPDGEPDRAGKTCDISHWLLGSECMMRGGEQRREWMGDGGINERRNRRTHQGALQFWRALICSGLPLLPQSQFSPPCLFLRCLNHKLPPRLPFSSFILPSLSLSLSLFLSLSLWLLHFLS